MCRWCSSTTRRPIDRRRCCATATRSAAATGSASTSRASARSTRSGRQRRSAASASAPGTSDSSTPIRTPPTNAWVRNSLEHHPPRPRPLRLQLLAAPLRRLRRVPALQRRLPGLRRLCSTDHARRRLARQRPGLHRLDGDDDALLRARRHHHRVRPAQLAAGHRRRARGASQPDDVRSPRAAASRSTPTNFSAWCFYEREFYSKKDINATRKLNLDRPDRSPTSSPPMLGSLLRAACPEAGGQAPAAAGVFDRSGHLPRPPPHHARCRRRADLAGPGEQVRADHTSCSPSASTT